MVNGFEYNYEYDELYDGSAPLQDYHEFCVEFIRKQVKIYGSIVDLARIIKVKPENISKVLNGNWIPSPKTMMKWFPGLDIINTYTLVSVDEGTWRRGAR